MKKILGVQIIPVCSNVENKREKPKYTYLGIVKSRYGFVFQTVEEETEKQCKEKILEIAQKILEG